ncbi:hypothetical protein evm_004758 [Chilo suppressalis]|nr:hypothetical protein evm_004758 [Chilo suppressalis]
MNMNLQAAIISATTMSPAKSLIFMAIILPCLCQRPFYAGKRPIGYPEVTGEVDYEKNLNSLPLDNRPFWFINKEHYANEQENPKVYPLRPSIFNDNNVMNGGQ